MKPRKPLRKQASKASIKRKLDALCRMLVMHRDRGCCRRCFRALNVQWAHVYSRRYLSMRWVPFNSMILCPRCHFWWHQQPLEAVEWVRGELVKLGTTSDKLSAMLNAGRKVNFAEEEAWLKQELKKVGIGVDA